MLEVNAGNAGFVHVVQIVTSVMSVNQVFVVVACLAFGANPECIAGVLRVEFFFFSSRRRHTRCLSDWSSDVCSSDLGSGLLESRIARVPASRYTNPLRRLRLLLSPEASHLPEAHPQIEFHTPDFDRCG